MSSAAEEIFGTEQIIRLATAETDELKKNILPHLPNTAGVVFFADAANRPIQLLTAVSIRKTVENKLISQAEKSKKADISKICSSIMFLPCSSRFRLALKYYDAVRKIYEGSYHNYIKFVFPFFIKLDFSARCPQFSITTSPQPKPQQKFMGIIGSQKAAHKLIKILQDSFGLCRCSDWNNYNSCAYLQMNSCCKVCQAGISPDEYKKLLYDAFDAAIKPARAIEQFGRQMKAASENLEFEKAAELKNKIEKLTVLKNRNYRWLADTEELKFVYIDKSDKVKTSTQRSRKQTVAVFVITFSGITDCGDFLIDDIDGINRAIADCKQVQFTDNQDTEHQELLAIGSYFLFRSGTKALRLKAAEALTAEKLKL